jgi:uncharacterized protein (TIGR00725 family)
MSSPRVISVFGSGDAARGGEEYAAAEQVGRLLAGLGYAVANGGYGGAMEAVSRGAAEAGAEVIGVPCRIWTSRTNQFLTRAVQTDDLHQRVRTLVELGTAGYVVLAGATGTLLELSLVWELSAKGILSGRPVVCVGEHWRPLAERIAARSPSAASCLRFVARPGQLRQHFPLCDLHPPTDCA